MNEKTINILNIILYYVAAPILVLEFVLADLNIISFTLPLFLVSMIILFILIAITMIYKKNNPKYEFKPNELYMRLLFLVVLVECFSTAGFFN